MSLVTVLWSMGAAAALTLAAVYGATWALERRLVTNLYLCVAAVATAAMARCELGMMHAATPAAFAQWMHWYYVPVFFQFVALLLFVRFYLGVGRIWLLWTIIVLRVILLAVNLFLWPTAFFSEISNLDHVRFLGEEVSVLGHAVERPWIWCGRASLVLAFLFVVDAVIQKWRQGDVEARRKASIVFAAVVLPGVASIALTQLGLAGVNIPYLDTPAFLVTLMVMAFELIRDVTVSNRSQLELAELRGNLTQLGRVSVIGQLGSALAHELNQPLGAILRNTDVAEMDLQSEKPDLEELRAIVADSGKAVRHAIELIERMRTLMKRRSVEMQPVAVDELVEDVISLARAEAASRQVLLSYAKEPGLPAVSGDRVHLSQVLLNLIINGIEAVQACPVGDRRVIIEARDAVAQIEITVRDSGPGVQAADIDKIFEPLFSTKSGGLGMGLAISRTIVEAHGGRLWADRSPEGAGAAFRFVLPRGNGTET